VIRKLRKNISPLIIAAGCLLLSACSGLLSSDRPADKTYMLTPFSPREVAEPGQHRQGLSLEFSVIPGLDSNHLQTVGPDGELNHISAARWPDHLPEFAGSLIRRSLLETGWYTSVSDGRDAGHDDCELVLEASEFYALLDHSGAVSSVQITLNGSYNCNDSNTPLKLEAGTKVAGNQVADVVAAFQSSLDRCTESLLAQLDLRSMPSG
jgi:ABC-type uncharacterized transport system auxiliary subunit